jgi:thiosulfate/3-mercaptopyruvate sulfurtransferase
MVRSKVAPWLLSLCLGPVIATHVGRAAPPNRPLVSPAWLNQNRAAPGTVVVSINGSEATFTKNGHIQGARLWDTSALGTAIDLPGGTIPWPTDQGVTTVVDRLGLHRSDHIILTSAGYTIASTGLAVRAFLILRAAGFTHVALLDGGTGNWVAQHFPLSHAAPPRITPSTVTITKPVPPWVDPVAKVHRIWQAHQALFIDARAPSGYSSGHIPGAINLPSALLFTEQSTFDQHYPVYEQFKPTPTLQALYRAAHIPSTRPIMFYCGSGLLSAEQVFVAKYLLHQTNVEYFPGSINAWDNANLPTVSGDHP